MAIFVDGAHMAKHWIPDHENHLDAPLGTARGRFAINKVYLHATVVFDPAKMRRLARARSDHITRARQAALDWQHDPGDALHDCEVFKHLHEIGETSFPYLYKDSTGTKSTTMSVDATSHRAGTRYSIKISMVRNDRNQAHGMYLITHTDLQKLFAGAGRGSWCKWGYEPKIFSSRRSAVVWQMQIDFVDLQRPAQKAISSSRSRKRRRTINEFQTVPPPKSHIRGVRWREERRMWMAETRIPGNRNKVWFGDYKTEAQAARAVDAAFYYYDKPLNFADSAQILACIPAPPAASKEEKQKFVKEVAKWVAHCNGPLVVAESGHEAHLQASTSAADQGHDVGGDDNSLDEFSMVLDDIDSCGGIWSTSTSVPPLQEHNNAQYDEYDAFLSLIMDSPAAPSIDHAMSPSRDFQGELLDCLMYDG